LAAPAAWEFATSSHDPKHASWTPQNSGLPSSLIRFFPKKPAELSASKHESNAAWQYSAKGMMRRKGSTVSMGAQTARPMTGLIAQRPVSDPSLFLLRLDFTAAFTKAPFN
jgi:hypothetical protein